MLFKYLALSFLIFTTHQVMGEGRDAELTRMEVLRTDPCNSTFEGLIGIGTAGTGLVLLAEAINPGSGVGGSWVYMASAATYVAGMALTGHAVHRYRVSKRRRRKARRKQTV